MSTLLDNQTYKRNFAYAKCNDHDKIISVSLSVKCNHQIDQSILVSIESKIKELLLKEY